MSHIAGREAFSANSGQITRVLLLSDSDRAEKKTKKTEIIELDRPRWFTKRKICIIRQYIWFKCQTMRLKETNRLPRHITLSRLDERKHKKNKLKPWIKPFPRISKLLAAPDLLASGTAAVSSLFPVICIVCCFESSAVACGTMVAPQVF